MYAGTLEIRLRVLGEGHFDTLISMNNLAGALRDQQKWEEAATLLGQAVDAGGKALPDGHWVLGIFHAYLGECQTKLHRYSEAEKQLLESYKVLQAAFGAEHDRTAKTVDFLVVLYESWDAAEPGKGYADGAAEYRAMLPAAADSKATQATPP